MEYDVLCLFADGLNRWLDGPVVRSQITRRLHMACREWEIRRGDLVGAVVFYSGVKGYSTNAVGVAARTGSGWALRIGGAR